jgi:hypothetical protein
VDASSIRTAHQALTFLRQFAAQQLRQEQRIVPTLHRLGSKEIVTVIQDKVKIKQEQDILDKRKLLPIIGPILECYPAEQVGFVLIITATPVIDFDDWAECSKWTSRLWVASIHKWQPYMGEIISLDGNLSIIIKKIISRITQEG